MKKKLMICAICLIGAGIAIFASLVAQSQRETHDAEAYIYDSEENAVVEGTQSTFQEWSDSTLGPNEKDARWRASKQKVAATYETQKIKYYLIYLDYVGEKTDYLDFFLAEVSQKQGKYSFKRISAFYGLVPKDQKEHPEDESMEVCGEATNGEAAIPLYFSCGKIKGTDSVYVDDIKKDNILKKSTELDLKVFGILDEKKHNIDIE